MIKGIGASKGVAIGKVFIKQENETQIATYAINDVEKELKRVDDAKEKAIQTLQGLFEKAKKEVGEEEAMIFDMHQMLLQDQDYLESIENIIKEEKINAEEAVRRTEETFAAIFAAMEDAYMQERAADIHDISKRLIQTLQGKEEASLANIDVASIVIAKDLYPSDTIQMNKEFVVGFITEDGGKMSHSAILARTMQIPAIVGLQGAMQKLNSGDTIVIDGESGEVHVNPTEAELKEWIAKQEEYKNYKQSLQKLIGQKSVTVDGLEIEVNANIGSPKDVVAANENDAEGVGLFRSEFLYMDNDQLPTEEQQFEAYKEAVEGMNGKRVIIRTLDVGGDKEIPYLNIPKEENPFLGYRAIRVCLEQQDMFKDQLRALLRASAYGKLGIMFPMIISVDEIVRAKALLEECKKELLAEGHTVSDDYEVGIMIETPAAVMESKALAEEVDFFSVGTNDLTQYLLAVDRMNAKIADLYNTANPAVLRAIKMAADNAHAAGIWIGICGESAADPSLTGIYAAMGIDELSVTPGAVLEVRKQIRSINASEERAKLKF